MSEEKDQKDVKASQDQVALEMMKFVATTTGYGKGPAAGAGFGGRTGTKSPEEHAEALLELFKKCRQVVQS
jgi:hypothetical protein